MGSRDDASESEGFASKECDPRMGSRDDAKQIREIRQPDETE